MVVIAEGLRSSTRHLLWGEEGFHSFGVIYAATMIDANHAVPAQVFQIYFMPGASIMLAHQRQTGFGPVLSGEFCEAAIPAIRSESFCGKVAICFNNPFER